MSPIQREAHERLIAQLPVRTIVHNDGLGNFKNFRRSPAEAAILKQKILDRRKRGGTIEVIAKELKVSTRTVRNILDSRSGHHHKR